MSDLLPEERRKKIDPSRNSQLYAKQMERARHGPLTALAQPGKRIGA
jgi:hypothetical protein